MPDLPYADAFPPATEDDWRGRVDAVLKGKPFDSLVGKTYDAIPIDPLYPPAASAPLVTRATRDWAIVQRLDFPGPESARTQALDDLGNGADGLQLVFAGALGAYGFGLPAAADAIDATLADVILDAEAPIEVDALDPAGAAAQALADCVLARKADPASTRIAFGIDPMGALARKIGPEWAAVQPTLAPLAQRFSQRGFTGPVFVADARLVHAAGGSEAQELAYALASALALLRALESGGVALDDARRVISFRIAVDADEFLGVAKLRALRRLWASIEEQCGLSPKPAHIHAETAWRMMTRRDSDVNMLRATLAVFSAAVGGADRISVLPHTQALGLPESFARRVARNCQLVLAAEANLGKVADPAAGSGGFETLTDALCDKAWVVFRAIEADGGLDAALANGHFRNEVAEMAQARLRNVAKRRDAVTGVSEYPLLAEAAPHVLAPCPAAPATGAFAPMRLAEPFETLRDRADAAAAGGARPRIALVALGSVAAYTARATFAKNLFEVGGFQTTLIECADDASGLGEAFRATGASRACLCSSDAVYKQSAVTAAKALAAAGAKRILLAGKPGDLEATLKGAGVTDFAFAGSDAVKLLESLQKSG